MRIVAILLAMTFAASAASAEGTDEQYLCEQLKRISAEEKVPAIGAGIVLREPLYPQRAPSPFHTIICATGVEVAGAPKKASSSTLFSLGSITKPITALIVARVIAQEQRKPNPRLRWDTTLKEFFPDIFSQPWANRCYAQRTVADLLAHTAGLPTNPAKVSDDPAHANDPTYFMNNQWADIEPDPIKRRGRYVTSALASSSYLDMDGETDTSCFGPSKRPKAKLPGYYSNHGTVIAAHMAELVTGRSWEDLMRRPGPTTAGPGLPLGAFADPAIAPAPLAKWHKHDDQTGVPVPSGAPGASPASGPNGFAHATVVQTARFVSEYLDASQTMANRMLPDAERAGLATTHALSGATRLGWSVFTLDTACFGPVGRWQSQGALWHNGSVPNAFYSEMYISPHDNAAMFGLLSATGAWALDPAASGECETRRAIRKIYAELAALRLHYGDALEIVRAHHQASVGVGATKPSALAFSGVRGMTAAPAIVDGRLATELAVSPDAATATYTVSYPQPRQMDRIVIIEDGGEKIREYELSIQNPNGTWTVLAKNERDKDLIFPHRIFQVAPGAPLSPRLSTKPPSRTVKAIRLRVLHSNGGAEIVEIAGAVTGKSAYRPLWWRRGLTHALAPEGPIIDPGPIKGFGIDAPVQH